MKYHILKVLPETGPQQIHCKARRTSPSVSVLEAYRFLVNPKSEEERQISQRLCKKCAAECPLIQTLMFGRFFFGIIDRVVGGGLDTAEKSAELAIKTRDILAHPTAPKDLPPSSTSDDQGG